MEYFFDMQGNQYVCLSKLMLEGTEYYITKEKKVFQKDEKGNFLPYDKEKNVILSSILKYPKSLDIIK